jgi:predicted PhzF superfamily epimerase YddE/YHI9
VGTKGTKKGTKGVGSRIDGSIRLPTRFLPCEDPVTGSAHCCLGPYWGERLKKRDLTGYQASARGGFVRVGVRGDRVRLGGQTVPVLRGELTG